MGATEKLNPRIRTIEVGIRRVEEVHVYPLSLGDELRFRELLVEIASPLLEGGSNTDFLNNILNVLADRIEDVCGLIFDEKEWEEKGFGSTFSDSLDNAQLMELLTLVYDMNFGEPSKKVAGVVQNLMKVLGIETSPESSPMSSDTTPNTELRTFSEEDSLTEG